MHGGVYATHAMRARQSERRDERRETQRDETRDGKAMREARGTAHNAAHSGTIESAAGRERAGGDARHEGRQGWRGAGGTRHGVYGNQAPYIKI